MNNLRQDIENIFNGQTPIKRQHPKAGESQYYFINPNQNVSSFNDLQTTDIPDEQPLFNTGHGLNQLDRTNDQNCYVEFNGQDVDLYKYGQHDGTRLQNGQLQGNLNGQSGADDYQSGIYQDVPNKGPIPEGTYYADQDQRQNITALDAVVGGISKVFNLPYGHWKGSLPAWGTSRVWLRPDASTNTYGRSGFSIHGGLTKGSAGCIDIPWQTGKLNNYLDDCQDSVPVYVKYPKDW